jgi:hypothetical protein
VAQRREDHGGAPEECLLRYRLSLYFGLRCEHC